MLVLRGDIDRKLTISEMDGNFTYIEGLIDGITEDIQLLINLNGEIHTATFSFVGGILATYSVVEIIT